MIPTGTLLDGVVRTLLEEVLPHVPGGYARGQLYTAVDVLQNLRDRVEVRRDLLEAEAESACAALEQARDAAAGPGCERARDRIARALAEAPEGPPSERVESLRRALAEAFEAVEALPEERAAAARRALGDHLAAQALRELALVKPSMLAEISQG